MCLSRGQETVEGDEIPLPKFMLTKRSNIDDVIRLLSHPLPSPPTPSHPNPTSIQSRQSHLTFNQAPATFQPSLLQRVGVTLTATFTKG